MAEYEYAWSSLRIRSFVGYLGLILVYLILVCYFGAIAAKIVLHGVTACYPGKTGEVRKSDNIREIYILQFYRLL